jgi:hypothetical protein
MILQVRQYAMYVQKLYEQITSWDGRDGEIFDRGMMVTLLRSLPL